MDPALGVDSHLIRVGKDDPGGAQGGEGFAGLHHVGPDGGGRVVSRPTYHGGAGRQLGGLSGGQPFRG